MGLCNDKNKLRPEFHPIVDWIQNKAKELGTNLVINETLRTDDVQIAYYAQGRKPLADVNTLRKTAGLWAIGEAENKKVVTNVPHVDISKGHGAGLAVDVVPDGNWSAPQSKWNLIGQSVDAAKQEFAGQLKQNHAELVWGGSWTKLQDYPHIEMMISKS